MVPIFSYWNKSIPSIDWNLAYLSLAGVKFVWTDKPKSNIAGETALFVSVRKITEVNKKYWLKRAEDFGFDSVVLVYRKDKKFYGEEFFVD